MRGCFSRWVAAAVGLLGVAAGAAAGVTHTVRMEGVRFEPAALTVVSGDTVVWVNQDPFPHTVTATSGSFDSRNIAPGRSWRLVARRPGSFPYVCTLHPSMRGVLQVEARGRRPR